ncbi:MULTISPECIES: CgeB family protein [Paenibacillus]|uniref:Spore maturation protein n=1 Tax=Paenibacillus albilobatus TaxID=2716884 RepID=A0A919XNT2_9BACL|nr:spore maturation protein [Paenibacillus albilobatus]
METKAQQNESYRHGYSDGYRFGVCQAVEQRVPLMQPHLRDIKILYVPQGFEAIDQGVTAALRSLVKELIVGEAPKMLELAAKERPDLVLVMNGLHVFPGNHLEDVARIRGMGIKTAIWFVDDPYFTEDTARMCTSYDTVFTHELGCVPFYRGLGAANVHYLPLAVHTGMFKPQRPGPGHLYDICFIGNAFWNRVAIFDEMAPFLENKNVLIAGGFWERLRETRILGRFLHIGFIPPEETVNYYNGAKIVINIHRPDEYGQDNRNSHGIRAKSINPRTYEISACGTLQITDIREDTHSQYRPGYDIETFGSVQELQDKIAYYLEHDDERLKLAWRGLWTTRKEHSFVSRLNTMLDLIP